MKTLIVYSSQSGNTKKLAEAVYDRLAGEKFLSPVEDNPSIEGFELVVVGFWLAGGKPDPASTKYLEELSPCKLFLFATHGAAPESGHAQNAMQAASDLASACQVVGTFNCQGEVNADLLAKVQKKEVPPPWIKDAPAAAGHPDESDISNLLSMLRADV